MAWETRSGSKGSYYTRSKRVNGRVVREYIGTGFIGIAAYENDILEREERQLAKAELKKSFEAAKKSEEKIDKQINKETIFIEDLAESIFLFNGFHKHKGQWRKIRDGKENRKDKA